MKGILAIALFALMGCHPPPPVEPINYYKDVNEDEYNDPRFDRFKYEQALPEYKKPTYEEEQQRQR